MAIHVSTQFDGGRIEVIEAQHAARIRLKIAKDSASDFCQWFYCRVDGIAQQETVLSLENAGQSSYPKWEGYHVLASYDRETWFRIPTEFMDGMLIARHTPTMNAVYYAYFTPYSHERHLDLLAQAQCSEFSTLLNLGASAQGRTMDCLKITEAHPHTTQHKKIVWVIARQHPGETMAEWCAEGLVTRLLDPDDALAKVLREQAIFYIIPNMNPDGAFLGNLRTNACGANLNREWMAPSLESSPEVYWVRQKIYETGVDCFLDLHGDEQLPYVFLAGCEGVPKYSEKQKQRAQIFKETLRAVNPDFQTEFGYSVDAPGEANLTLATDYIGEHFGCLAYTLEMPFKDNANLPDPDTGWSAERSLLLGASLLHPISAVL